MHFIPTASATLLRLTIKRYLSTLPKLPKLSKIPSKHRPKVVAQAQQALTDYLHATRSISFTYADIITKNSLFSLSNLISKVPYSSQSFNKDFDKYLMYHPPNEFEFFFESIGIPFHEIDALLLPSDFLSDGGEVLEVACALSAFGFPWKQLGKLYKDDISVFGKNSDALVAKLNTFLDIGFDTSAVIGICLTFPFVLSGNVCLSSEVDALLDIMKRVFLECGLKSCVEGNVDACYEFCRKIKFFLDLGCGKKEVGELMGKSWNAVFECSEETLVQKVDFFRRLNAKEDDIGILLLRCPEILNFDLESSVFSIMTFLEQFGLSEEERNAIVLKYPYVLGNNRLKNLPHLMRAVDLHAWFFEKIMNGNHHLLDKFEIGTRDEKLEEDYQSCVEKIQSLKNYKHAAGKLNFLLGLGFGENLTTIKVFHSIHGTGNELQERFDYLLDAGIEFSKLCRIVKLYPKVLNQCPDVVQDKLDFLRNEVGSSLEYLDVFPGFLCFDLENRMKPRYRIYKWLNEIGAAKPYSLSSLVATSENNFIERLIWIHPTVLKQWFERFSSKKHYYRFE